MTAHRIYKVSHEGLGRSSVDWNGVRRIFATAIPRGGRTFREQADNAFDALDGVLREEDAHGTILQQTVFLADIGQLDACRRLVREFYGPNMPATSYIPQRPCNGQMLAIECVGLGRDRNDVVIQRVNEQLVIVRHDRVAWAHFAATQPPSVVDAYTEASFGFERLQSRLVDAHFDFAQVVRLWLYCGGIIEHEGAALCYQEMNRARADFFRGVRFGGGGSSNLSDRAYPASTGIGIDGRSILVGATALASDRKDLRIVPLENPRQTPAYNYATRYSPSRPRFSRGLAVSDGKEAIIFISGTASIVGEETRHPHNAVAQTEETLDNVASLISEENLACHGLPGMGTSLDGLAAARVYVKRAEDFAMVRDACERRLGVLPMIYAQADVCRPDLLVEIEGVAFSRRSVTWLDTAAQPPTC
jgi:enamine deaminase RidA (YjgF/YER057c/UK114 family)